MTDLVAFCKIPGVPFDSVNVQWEQVWTGTDANPFTVEQRGDVWIVIGDPTGVSGQLELRPTWTIGEHECRPLPAILRTNPAAVIGCYVAERWDLFPSFATQPDWRRGDSLTVYMTDGGADTVDLRLFAAEGYATAGEAAWSVRSGLSGEIRTASGTFATGTIAAIGNGGVSLHNADPHRNDRVSVSATRNGLTATATVVIGRTAPNLERYFEVWP